MPTNEEEPFSNIVSSDGNKQSEADSVEQREKSLEMNTEDNINAAWWNKKLQKNSENELFNSLEDEDDTDIRFKLPSTSSGTNISNEQLQLWLATSDDFVIVVVFRFLLSKFLQMSPVQLSPE